MPEGSHSCRVTASSNNYVRCRPSATHRPPTLRCSKRFFGPRRGRVHGPGTPLRADGTRHLPARAAAHADADDAFQATFLVLVRRVAEVRCRATLGNWLYGVAYRTALHARTVNARRRRIEGQVRPMERDDSPQDAAMRPELQTLLDQELNRLPAKYRECIVLCDLLGKTIREAARQLRCPEGTVCSRLARGRELLRQRLARRGTALTLAALTVYLAQNKAPAAAPLITQPSRPRRSSPPGMWRRRADWRPTPPLQWKEC